MTCEGPPEFTDKGQFLTEYGPQNRQVYKLGYRERGSQGTGSLSICKI